jgi:DNA-binding Lrp family transcriptional regulator
LDEIDKKIVSQLQENGRTTLEELSKKIGFTSMGTKKRLEKLLKNSTIKVSALINPIALKLHPAIVMLEMPPGNPNIQNRRRLQPNRTCCSRNPRNP